MPAAGGTPVEARGRIDHHPVPRRTGSGGVLSTVAPSNAALGDDRPDGTGKARAPDSRSPLAPVIRAGHRDGQELASVNLIDGPAAGRRRRARRHGERLRPTGRCRRTTSFSSVAGWRPTIEAPLHGAAHDNDRELYSMRPERQGPAATDEQLALDDSDPAPSPRRPLDRLRPRPFDPTRVHTATLPDAGRRHAACAGSRIRRVHGRPRPSWSPDGTRIVFSSNRDTNGTYHLYLLDIATGKVTRLTKGRAQASAGLVGRRRLDRLHLDAVRRTG